MTKIKLFEINFHVDLTTLTCWVVAA